MKALFLRRGALILAIGLAGCTTAGGGGNRPVEVTRFHLQEPIARGQIAVEPFVPGAGSMEYDIYAAAVKRELARLGWTVVDTIGQSEQIALLDVHQSDREAPPRRGPVSVGVGGGAGSYGGGVGVGVGFNLGGRKHGGVSTMLEVRIKRRSDATVFWEGRASSEIQAQDPAARSAAVDRLAQALFRDFPGESGQTIRTK